MNYNTNIRFGRHFSDRTLMKILLSLCTLFAVAFLIATEILSHCPVTSSARGIVNDYMFQTLQRDLGSTEVGERVNLSEVVSQYRSLVEKYLEKSEADVEVSPEDVDLLPPQIQQNERFKVLMKRVLTARRICATLKNSSELRKHLNEESLLEVLSYHMVICRNPKAASSALGVYVNGLYVYHLVDYHMDILRELSTHKLLRDNEPPPSYSPKHLLMRQDKLNLVAVRHPFQRAVSCFLNKVQDHNAYRSSEPELYADMMKFSKLSPKEAQSYMLSIFKSNLSDSQDVSDIRIAQFRCPHDIKAATEETFSEANSTELTKPTFRGFALGIVASLLYCRGDTGCLWDQEKHYRSQVIKCAPCAANYDLIVKSETLEEDMTFVEELMQLPPAWQLHQQILASNQAELSKMQSLNQSSGSQQDKDLLRANVSKRNRPYGDYMSQLTRGEMNLLYTVYFYDFKVFDYDPCDGL